MPIRPPRTVKARRAQREIDADKAAATAGRRGIRTPRMLGHGDLPLLLLWLMQGQARHGYELIQLIGEIFHGKYQPSAGAVYPALAQLQADGLVETRADGTRRLNALTDRGRQFVETHADVLQQARLRTEQSARSLIKGGLPAPVRARLGEVKRALAGHHARWSSASTEAAAAILAEAAARIAALPD